jgi:hypothetical protein
VKSRLIVAGFMGARVNGYSNYHKFYIVITSLIVITKRGIANWLPEKLENMNALGLELAKNIQLAPKIVVLIHA